jgi:hypothetical protein
MTKPAPEPTVHSILHTNPVVPINFATNHLHLRSLMSIC